MTNDKSSEVLGATYAMLVITTLAVGLRFWSRHIATKAGFWWDDWCSLAAWPCVIAQCGINIWWVRDLGLGKHIYDIPRLDRHPVGVRKALFITNQIYAAGLSLAKMSVLLFYYRIFGTSVQARIAFWIIGLLIVGWLIALNILSAFSCTPVQKGWNEEIPGHCLYYLPEFLGATISNIIIDVIILCAPLPFLWKLHIKRPRKAALIAVFLAGYCVVIISILRLVSIIQLGSSLAKDPTFNIAYSQTLVSLEMSIALISGCLPSIFSFLNHSAKHLMPNLRSILPGSSKALSATGGSHIGPLSNPIDSTRDQGKFEPLESRQGSTNSQQSIYDGPQGTKYTSNIFSDGQQDQDFTMNDLDHAVSVQQIRVTRDVEINS